MTQEEFKKMMDELTAAEIENLKVGSEEFKRRHKEIMILIQDAKERANGETSYRSQRSQ